jgi:formylglycine-generating enzyme required for sulfatase activity
MFKWMLLIIPVFLLLLSCNNATKPTEAVPLPIFSPTGGTFLSVQDIEISTSVVDATIRFTLDGSEPNKNSERYTTPITISGMTTIKAKAWKSGKLPSETAVANYQLDISALYYHPPSGVYSTTFNSALYSATNFTEIRFTLDGTEPTETSAIYSSPIGVNVNTTIRAKGFRSGWTPTETCTISYTLKPLPPFLAVPGGTFSQAFNLWLTHPNNFSNLRYTIDGTEPNESSILYDGSILVDSCMTVTARAFKNGWTPSESVSESYYLKPMPPIFSQQSGNYYNEIVTEIISGTSGCVIHYTTDGSNPDSQSPVYSQPLSISQNTVLKAIACKQGWLSSDTTTASYNFTTATPTIQPVPGSYNHIVNAVLSCPTQNAQIRYTLDGTEPNQSSQLYTSPLVLNNTVTVRAKAFKNGWASSLILTAVYNINIPPTIDAPVFTPPGGEYTVVQNVSISCPTNGVYIRFTTDGSDPDTNSNLYINPITVGSNAKLKARAYRTGWQDSPITTAEFIINIYHEPLVFVPGGQFNMGCTSGTGDDDEYPVHPVILSSFFISDHEVTQEEYLSVTGTNPSYFSGQLQRPVDSVSFYDAIAYCNKKSIRENLQPCYEYINYGFDIADWPTDWNTSVHNNLFCHFYQNGYRLPTEAEWEYAAKGGQNSNNYLYSGSNNLDLVGWYGSNSGQTTHIVRTKAPNELGLYDMSGNLWEIVWDWYGSYYTYTDPEVDPQGPLTGIFRGFRGGFWQADASYSRNSNRSNAGPANTAASYGFRVVRSSL